MNVRDTKPKSKISSVRLQQLGASSVGLTKKELLTVYNALAAAAKLLEDRKKTRLHASERAMMVRQVEEQLPKHLGRAITAAEKWQQRDLLCRHLSAYYMNWRSPCSTEATTRTP